MRDPLSLENCCLVKIIGDLESFPPDALAFLPHHLRLKLLHNLPAADVCQLEETSVVAGLSVDDIWEAIFKRNRVEDDLRMQVYVQYDGSSKNYYLSYLCACLLNHIRNNRRTHVNIVLDLLFCVENFLNSDEWHDLPHYLVAPHGRSQAVVPQRYAQYFVSSNYSDAQLINIVLETTKYFPKSLNIICDRFARCIHSQFWLNQNNPVLANYLSQVHSLSLSDGEDSRGEDPACYFVPTFVFNVIFATEPVLKSLYIHSCSHKFLESAVISARPYLKCNISVPFENSTIKLTNFGASTYGLGHISDSTAFELALIIENQPSLSYINLEFRSPPDVSSTSVGHFQLYSALSSSIRQPQFHTLRIDNTSLSLASLQELVYSFLTAPCTRKQLLSLYGVVIKPNKSKFNPHLLCFNIPKEGISYKTLEICGTDIPAPILTWLQVHTSPFLKKVTFHDISSDVFPAILGHASLHVENVALTCSELPPQLKSTRCFDAILTNTCLKQLDISYNLLGRTGHLLDLVSGLNAQALLGTLELLDISGNALCDAPDIEVKLLFDALLSLPQLERFELDISTNCSAQQIQLFHDCWEQRCNSRKLKALICYDDGDVLDLEDVLCLENLAVNLTTGFQ